MVPVVSGVTLETHHWRPAVVLGLRHQGNHVAPFSFSLRSPLVLIVGDAYAILAERLSADGYRVATAASAQEGLELAVALTPDFVLIHPHILDDSVASPSAHGAAGRIRVVPVA